MSAGGTNSARWIIGGILLLYFWVKHTTKVKTLLTDVVVALARAELLAQGEGCIALKLLGELLGGVLGERLAALPAHLIVGLRLTRLVVFTLHHIQHVALCLLRRCCARRVMWAHDVQVVVQTDWHDVLVQLKTTGKRKEKDRLGYGSTGRDRSDRQT